MKKIRYIYEEERMTINIVFLERKKKLHLDG